MSASDRPVIGITPEERDARGNIILPAEYVDAVMRAGGIPVILPVWNSSAAHLLAAVDGLILAGGGDIDPELYGGEAHPAIYSVDHERDEQEIALARLALERQTPTLGICRGAQVVNVALGGTLVEHLDGDSSQGTRHRADPPAYVPHSVEIRAGSLLAHIMETSVSTPLSWHHQAIRSVAPILDAVAVAPDGTIEAVESAGHPFFLAVQWHPEMTANQDPQQQRLFNALVVEARSSSERRRAAVTALSFERPPR